MPLALVCDRDGALHYLHRCIKESGALVFSRWVIYWGMGSSIHLGVGQTAGASGHVPHMLVGNRKPIKTCRQ